MASPVDGLTSTLPNLNARMAHLYETKMWADVEFLVGTQPNAVKFSAHKCILSASSPVFEAMFKSTFVENNGLVNISDVNPVEFEKFLRFIYTDTHGINSVNEAFILFNVGKKYMMNSLAEQCIAFMESAINPQNVCEVYEFGKFHEQPGLTASCWKMMTTRTTEVIQSESFMNCNLETLIELFEQKRLGINSELDLFHALEKYATINAEKVDLEPGCSDSPAVSVVDSEPMDNNAAFETTIETPVDAVGTSIPQKKPHTIHDAVKLIRWLTLQPAEVAPLMSGTKLLTRDEKLDILLNISSPNANCAMPMGFVTTRQSRKALTLPNHASFGTSIFGEPRTPPGTFSFGRC